MLRATILSDTEAGKACGLISDAIRKLRAMDQGTGAFRAIIKDLDDIYDILSKDENGNYTR